MQVEMSYMEMSDMGRNVVHIWKCRTGMEMSCPGCMWSHVLVLGWKCHWEIEMSYVDRNIVRYFYPTQSTLFLKRKEANKQWFD